MEEIINVVEQESPKTFTQDEVNKIVQDRLAREKVKLPDDYNDLQEIANEIGEYFQGATPAEKKTAIKAYKEQAKQQQELAELEEQARTTGTDSELLKEIRTLKKEIEESKKTIAEISSERNAKIEAEKVTKEQQENWKKQVLEFNDKFQDIDLKTLEADEDFLEYATDRKGTLSSLYEGYVKFTSKLKKETVDDVTKKFKIKELLSTGTGKGSAETDTHGLTENQKNLAKSNGMSYKDYANLLKYAE